MGRRSNLGRWLELFGVFVALPVAFSTWGVPRVSPLPVLVSGALVAWLVLRRVHGSTWRTEWNWGAVATALPGVLIRVALAAIAMTALVGWWMPDELAALPRRRPGLWVLIMVGYPVVSVVPQELLWRSFFFRRYERLLGTRDTIVASGLAFGLMHVVFRNWIAVVATVVGGLVFARTYHRTRSLAVVSLEHALYGCLIFTVGLGPFFYHAAVGDQFDAGWPPSVPPEAGRTAPDPPASIDTSGMESTFIRLVWPSTGAVRLAGGERPANRDAEIVER